MKQWGANIKIIELLISEQVEAYKELKNQYCNEIILNQNVWHYVILVNLITSTSLYNVALYIYKKKTRTTEIMNTYF